MKKRRRVPLRIALSMLAGYARSRIIAQIKAIAFIIVYLVIFQVLILRVPLSNSIMTAGGIALVIFGLAFFLEGLVLGFMPLGERVGAKLPSRTNIFVVALFGLVLGFGTTLAEPAVSALRTAGSILKAWESPLLYMVLEKYTEWLVLAIGTGVGVAVSIGTLRFYYNISIKPFILILTPLLLIISVYFSFDKNLSGIMGLAWDCGAVTTGAVTVPLVLALGLGVSRTAGKGKGTASGFGVVLLASYLPVLSVMILGYIINFRAPEPTTETNFFSPGKRDNALAIFDNDTILLQHAFIKGSETGRRAFFDNEDDYHKVLLSLKTDSSQRSSLIGNMDLDEWLINIASEQERDFLPETISVSGQKSVSSFKNTIKEEAVAGFRAVIPLSLLLIIVLTGFLREKLKYKDEIVLGIVFTLAGITLLTSGIKLGLASLGGEVGAQLPRAFSSEEEFIDRIVINNFDKNLLFHSIAPDGTKKTYFNYTDNKKIRAVEFFEEDFDEESGKYEYIITRPPLFGSKLSILGIILVLLFAFGMGYGATMAEPALNALGMTVETITVGTIKKIHIVQAVSVGVGIGILAGLCRILFNIPLVWLIVPAYIFLILLTLISEEEITSIAWDSGGVTTGPVTVPLVLAMGLSIGGELNVSDGFGVLALASAFPIITVLIFGLSSRSKQRRSILKTQKAAKNG